MTTNKDFWKGIALTIVFSVFVFVLAKPSIYLMILQGLIIIGFIVHEVRKK